MKDYMASGSFARGKEEKAASASMFFVGNINQSVDVLLKAFSLFDPFPPEMGRDTAFLDRIHCYNPGWEIPKFRSEHFTNDYEFNTDYLSGWVREMRKVQYGDAIDKYFRLGKNLNRRDTIAVRRFVDGYTKLLYSDGEFTKDDIQEILIILLEMRRRVKEQLKKLGGMEFYDVNFSYIDMDDMSEHYVSVPEQDGGKLIPEGKCNLGQVYTVSHGKSNMIGVFRLDSLMLSGSGKFDKTSLGSDRECKESVDTAFNFLKANGNRISGSISAANKDYIINYQDQGLRMTKTLHLPILVVLCSIALQRLVQNSMVILGDFSIGGTILEVENLASTLQVCLVSGAKKVLLPTATMMDLATVPLDLKSAFQLVPYSDPADAVFKALGGWSKVDINSLAKKIQEYLADSPLVVLGSGASVPYGLPTMGRLASELSNDPILQAEKDSDKLFSDMSKIGLEAAIDRNALTENAKTQIREVTWKCISNADIELYRDEELADRLQPMIQMIKKIITASPNQLTIVTTNYDRLSEYATDIYGATTVTGFEGNLLRKFDGFSEDVNRRRIAARERVVKILKVHGSLDWFQDREGNTVSRPVQEYLPLGYTPLIVPPGKEKYSTTHEEPYRTVIEEADKEFRKAGSFLCVGYGFNDSHIQPKLITQIKDGGKPIVVITKQATEECLRLVTDANVQKYLILEENGTQTKVITNEGEYTVKESVWSLDNFMKVW